MCFLYCSPCASPAMCTLLTNASRLINSEYNLDKTENILKQNRYTHIESYRNQLIFKTFSSQNVCRKRVNILLSCSVR